MLAVESAATIHGIPIMPEAMAGTAGASVTSVIIKLSCITQCVISCCIATMLARAIANTVYGTPRNLHRWFGSVPLLLAFWECRQQCLQLVLALQQCNRTCHAAPCMVAWQPCWSRLLQQFLPLHLICWKCLRPCQQLLVPPLVFNSRAECHAALSTEGSKQVLGSCSASSAG